MADWDGVGLDGTPRRVTSLVLKGKELTGSIPTSFGSLAMLDTLALAQNQLTGAIPVELGNLANLTHLQLDQNQLTGSIPAELGNLTKMTYLSLGLNQLSGTIPAELGNLTKLTDLWLKRNQLTGSIPPQLGNLTLLTHLVLDNNQLAGAVREELWSLTGLTSLYLAGNMLVGCVPEEWHDVANNDLDQLGIEACSPQRVCGTGTPVPDPAANPGLVEDCETLLAWRNMLAGTATLDWSRRRPMTSWTGVTIAGTPQRVTKLELANGGLTGELSGLVGQLQGLRELRLNGNALTGQIPSKVAQLNRLTHVYLAGNVFTGCMPPALRAVANNDLATLGLADCGAPVDIPDERFATLTAGTNQYIYFWDEDAPALVFEVPDGLQLETYLIVMAGPGEVGLLLQVVNSEAFIGLHVYRGVEWGRARSAEDADRLDPLFDRLVESAWIDDREAEGK